MVKALAGDDRARCVWQNEVGGLTFELSHHGRRRFLKWAPVGSGVDIGAEVARLAWAGRFTPVPRYLESGRDDTGAWLLTDPLPGKSAVSARWKRQPRLAVIAIGEGLRGLHDALPVDECRFSWSAADRVSDARQRAALDRIDPRAWHFEHREMSVDQALDKLTDIPSLDRAVVCHGDACAPNTILRANGRWSGHVDLGAMGVADRWADLAVATWSATWNYGPGWEQELLAAYGVDPDPVRTDYYRLLWDLDP
ncbi:MAG TPA: aminoglycoside 3'-phosphotransferase [Candidatus Saccharimonadales bacterium]|nr:aminoglycoside 3'-phosphotransferase [Candidatus Saccharimonadales bacterium]